MDGAGESYNWQGHMRGKKPKRYKINITTFNPAAQAACTTKQIIMLSPL